MRHSLATLEDEEKQQQRLKPKTFFFSPLTPQVLWKGDNSLRTKATPLLANILGVGRQRGLVKDKIALPFFVRLPPSWSRLKRVVYL